MLSFREIHLRACQSYLFCSIIQLSSLMRVDKYISANHLTKGLQFRFKTGKQGEKGFSFDLNGVIITFNAAFGFQH